MEEVKIDLKDVSKPDMDGLFSALFEAVSKWKESSEKGGDEDG